MNPETEVVTVDRFADLFSGDVVVDTDRTYDGDFARVRRVLPPKPVLPTTEGSIITQTRTEKNAGRVLVSAVLANGSWRNTANGRDILWPEHWASGWTLIYEAPALPTRDVLAEVIWTANHNDEGTISASGANIVAARVLDFLQKGK